MRRAVAVVALGAASVLGCATAPPRAVGPDGRVSFELVREAERDVDGQRAQWRVEPGVSVTVQPIARSDDFARDRELSAVAHALETRYRLGVAGGGMAAHPCRAGGHRAFCLDGTLAKNGVAYVKRGVLVETDDGFALVEVTGTLDRVARVQAQRELVRRTIVVGTAG